MSIVARPLSLKAHSPSRQPRRSSGPARAACSFALDAERHDASTADSGAAREQELGACQRVERRSPCHSRCVRASELTPCGERPSVLLAPGASVAQAPVEGDAVRRFAAAEAHEWINAGHAALVLRLVINSPCNDLCR